MLSVEGIDVYYGGVQALRGVSLEVGEGEMVAIVGPNGAGKTTTLRAVSGLVRPRRGRVTLDGQPVHELAAQEIVRLGVSHVPEGRGIFASLTVLENLRMGAYASRRDGAGFAEDLERVMSYFPVLGDRAGQMAGSLSGGEQQMLAIARGLVARPRLLMIDELSLGLAPRIVQQLFGILEDINREGLTVLLIEQFVNLALKSADRAYVLAKGSVVLEGDAARLLADRELVQSSYLGSSPDGRNGGGRTPKRAPKSAAKRSSARAEPSKRAGAKA